MISPSKKDFLAIIKDGKIPPLYEEIPYSSPSLIYESLASTNSFLLESVKGPEKIARYSFIGFDPCLIFKTRNSLIEIESSEKKTIFSNKPLSVLKNLVKTYRQKPFENLPPFQGGLAGILSYDFVQYFERLPNNSVDDLNLPD
ncbi:MAG: anthranilate synthase component I, partial [Bacteroidetes bacterium]